MDSGTIRIVVEAVTAVSLAVAAIYGNVEAKAKEADYLVLFQEYQSQIIECYKGYR